MSAQCEHTREESRELLDARGIYVARVCDKCERAVRAQYRPDVFKNQNYWHDEPIEPDY